MVAKDLRLIKSDPWELPVVVAVAEGVPVVDAIVEEEEEVEDEANDEDEEGCPFVVIVKYSIDKQTAGTQASLGSVTHTRTPGSILVYVE